MKRNKLFALLFALILALGVLSGFTYPNTAQAMSPVAETAFAETMTVDGKIYNVKASYQHILDYYYSDFIDCLETSDLLAESTVSFQEFCDAYYGQNVYTISQYSAYLKEVIDEQTTSFDKDILIINSMEAPEGGGNEDWWINFGSVLPYEPNYNGFLFDIQAGDIIYEEEGIDLLVWNSGHTAIVEGVFDDPNYGNYWRLIESVLDGVVRSVLDSDRMVYKKSHILTVVSANPIQRAGAVNFAIAQLGKGYMLQLLTRPISSNVWMCSTLVWASYKNQNIDLVPGTGGVLPIDLFNSSLTQSVTIANYSFLRMQIVSRSGFIIYNWVIKLINDNPFSVSVTYNSKMCFENDGKTYKGLKHLVTVTIPAGGFKEVAIDGNGTAGWITASINAEAGNASYRIVSYTNGLSPNGLNPPKHNTIVL